MRCYARIVSMYRTVIQFIWVHRTVALIVATCWNVLIYFAWRAESIPHGLTRWLPLLFAAVFALLIPVSIIADRRRRMAASRAERVPEDT